MAYYKGFIVSNDYIEKFNYREIFGYTHTEDFGTHFYSSFEGKMYRKVLNKNIRILNNIMVDILKKSSLKSYIEDKELIKALNNIYNIQIGEKYQEINKTNQSTGSATYILYEIVKDKNGNIYGKELYTKKIFPILTDLNKKIIYEIECHRQDDYYYYYLNIIPSIQTLGLLQCYNLIVSHTLANKNEVDAYLKKYSEMGFFKKIFNQKEKTKHFELILKLSNENIFKEDIFLEEAEKKTEIIKVNQSVETILMEEIEYNLLKLNNIDKELYMFYKNKYEELLNGVIRKEDLTQISGEIEYYLLFKKRNILDILDIINNLKKEYLENFISNCGNKTNLDFKKLDKINELFLKVKDKYDIKNQREVLKNLAFLYLLEAYENIDVITEKDLENSYFVIYLKSIVVWISLFLDENIIECDYLISLREELNVKIVLDLIKNIRFREIESDKLKKLVIK